MVYCLFEAGVIYLGFLLPGEFLTSLKVDPALP